MTFHQSSHSRFFDQLRLTGGKSDNATVRFVMIISIVRRQRGKEKAARPVPGLSDELVRGVTDIRENQLRAQAPQARPHKKRSPLIFKQADLTRALKGAAQAGQVATRAEIDRDGKISLTFSGEQTTPPPSARDWDEALNNGR
jgi:hypothetical protein